MKYNIFDIMIMLAFVLFSSDSEVLWLIGCAMLGVSGIHYHLHPEEYMEEEEYEEEMSHRHPKDMRKMPTRRKTGARRHAA